MFQGHIVRHISQSGQLQRVVHLRKDPHPLTEREECLSPERIGRYIPQPKIEAMPKGSWREFDSSGSKARPVKQESMTLKAQRPVRVQRTRGGKGGKTVTIISGLELQPSQSKLLLKRLKASCGTGGTLKEDCLELQGDQVDAVLEYLRNAGFAPKRSGG